MIIVEAIASGIQSLIESEKEMVKLGSGVFATRQIGDRAPFETGLGRDSSAMCGSLNRLALIQVINRRNRRPYRKAQNGEAFLSECGERQWADSPDDFRQRGKPV